MTKRKPRLQPDLSQRSAGTVAPVGTIHDPQEVRIYIKQLKKALKFLPLGSRGYYYVSGEILRASTQLKMLASSASAGSQKQDSSGSSPDSNEGN